uniref:helix-turn-helix domain-containing protein n=1 Tax=Agathobacter rectalis TaxID=39491 RepID=UPI004024C721
MTGKEFDIPALLAANPKRVFTYELITDIVWKEDYNFYSRKAIHNHVSKLRKKLRFEPNLPNYIESVAGIGYKFEYLSAP